MSRAILIHIPGYSDTPSSFVTLTHRPRRVSDSCIRDSKELCGLDIRRIILGSNASDELYDPFSAPVFEDDEIRHCQFLSDSFPSPTSSPSQTRAALVNLGKTLNQISYMAPSADDSLKSRKTKPDGVASLSVVLHFNNYVPYSTMTFGAFAGAGLFTWEQSVQTVSMSPIIPMTLFGATILCTLGLPLSLVVADEIKDLQASLDSCPAIFRVESKRDRIKRSANHAQANARDEKLEKMMRPNGVSSHDQESLVNPNVKCSCIQCIPRARRFITYFFLYLPSVFSAMSLVLCIITLIALMFATETHETAVISTATCIPAIAAFLCGLAWFLSRRLGWTNKA